MSRLALSSIKNRGEGSWALCTSFLIPDTLRLHTPNAYNNPFSPPPIKNPKSASEQSHPIMGSKRLALPSNQCCPGSNPCVDAMCGWVCGWFSPLLRKLFLRVLGFSPLLKNQDFHFQIGCSTSKSLFIIIFFLHKQLTTSAQYEEGTVIPELFFTSHARPCSKAANQSAKP